MITVPVRVGDRGYDVLVGARAREALPSVIPPRAKRVAVVTQATVPLEVEPGRDHRVFVIDEGETAKSLTTVEGLCRDFARFGLTRGDVVVSVGGGLVTDVAGFAAAVYHRGVASDKIGNAVRPSRRPWPSPSGPQRPLLDLGP